MDNKRQNLVKILNNYTTKALGEGGIAFEIDDLAREAGYNYTNHFKSNVVRDLRKAGYFVSSSLYHYTIGIECA